MISTGGSIRTVERLDVGQAIVSARIRTLEQQQLGRSPFVRNKCGATQTPTGELFLRYTPDRSGTEHCVEQDRRMSSIVAVTAAFAPLNDEARNHVSWAIRHVHHVADLATMVVGRSHGTSLMQVPLPRKSL